MRVIKFRAYNDKVGLFYQDGRTLGSFFDHYVHPIELWELMQFTGLTDKNGKEIYDGDIITNSNHNCHYIISWDEKGCCYIGTGDEGDKYGPYTLKISISSRYEQNLFKNELEIVGNIHENPELLGG